MATATETEYLLGQMFKCYIQKNPTACKSFYIEIVNAVVVTALENELGVELVATPHIREILVANLADVDPDGTLASQRFFPDEIFSRAGLAATLELATNYRDALSNVVSKMDEEIKALQQKVVREK
jgi:hypothetical protein